MILLLACVENAVGPKGGGSTVADTGDWTPPGVDTDGDSAAEDSGADTAEVCAALAFPGTGVAFDADCDGSAPAADPAWNLVERWRVDDLAMPTGPAVIVPLDDDNGDGVVNADDPPEIVVAGGWSGDVVGVTAFHGGDGRVLWQEFLSDVAWPATPATGDVDLDGVPDVYLPATKTSWMLSGVDGAALWTGDGAFPSTYGAGGLADFDGDGAPEAFIGLRILDAHTGDLRVAEDGAAYAVGRAMSVAADIDLDGTVELVAGNAVFDASGNARWTAGDDVGGFPAVANFDRDDAAEILVAQDLGATLYDTDGTELWTWSYPEGDRAGPPAVADVDGDGTPEAILPSTGGVAVVDAEGTERWSFVHDHVDGGIYFDGASAYDLDGDGRWEVALTTPSELVLLDGDGDVLTRADHDGLEVNGHEPTFADLDADGHVEIVVPFGDTCGGPGGVVVFADSEGFTPGGAAWNEHAYHLTNIEPDGAVPATATPNWLDTNNFRAGPSMTGFARDQNLVALLDEVCDAACDEGALTVWWQLGNSGTAEVTAPVVVELWGETDAGDVLLASETVTEPLPAGWMGASHETTLTGVPPLRDLRLHIDAGEATAECDETDNALSWGHGLCGG